MQWAALNDGGRVADPASAASARVTSEAEVNTFLTEWSESPACGGEAFDKTLADATLCNELLRSLQMEGAYAAARGDAKQAAWQSAVQLELRNEMNRKIDETTADFLSRADEFANIKAMDCSKYLATDGLRFGLWVNLAKSARAALAS